jgi:diguanylate cyclase (GGDEF)-like protein
VLFAASLNVMLGVILRSYQMAYRDELTGLPARRALWEQLQKLGGRFSIAMVDIDHFKKFNDRHGHDVGDQVLQMVASHLARVRGGGRAFRYGGEEFALLFSGKLSTEAEPFAEALRQSVADARFRMRDRARPRKKPSAKAEKKVRAYSKTASAKVLRVTVSIGLADSAGPADTRLEVLKNADKALYRAKRKGRNRVES